jgi:hypothetical protein
MLTDAIAIEDFTDVDIKIDYAANNFVAWDRFGRVRDQIWSDWTIGLGSTSPCSIKLGDEEILETLRMELPRDMDVNRNFILTFESDLNCKYRRKSEGKEIDANYFDRYRDTTHYYFRVEQGPPVYH